MAKDILKLEKLAKKFFRQAFEIEQKVANELRVKQPTLAIYEKIKKTSDPHEVSRFLYNAGLDKTLLDYSLKRLEKGKKVSWAYLLKIFIKHDLPMKPHFVEMIFHTFLKKKENEHPSLLTCQEWGNISTEFEQMRLVHLAELEKKTVSKETELLEKLHFIQVQNLIEEEEEIIQALISINPLNKQYQALKADLIEKKAIQMIEKEKKQIQERGDEIKTPEIPVNKAWVKAIEKEAGKHPEKARKLAIFLYSLGFFKSALSLLEKNLNTLPDYWFYLDWLLEARQYARGLEVINQIFAQVKESESYFLPLVYMKSQMLYGLGKKKEALDHLTAIAQVQPDYKSVQYLLNRWSGV